MSVISGFGGAVDTIPTVRGWSVTSTSDITRYVASGSKKGASRIAGNRDWNGQYTAYGGIPAKKPGDIFTFTGSLDAVNGVEGSAMVEEVVINWDIEAGGIISHEVTFSSNGVLTLGAAVATDATVPAPLPAVGTKIEEALAIATPVFTEITDIRTITLTISRNNPSYASSSTAGDTKRVMGTLDMSISFGVYEGDPADLIAVNGVRHLKVYIDATNFWELKWVRFGEASDVDCDIEDGGLVSATMNAEMEGFTDVAGTATEGYIKDPTATPVTWWPA